MKFFYLRDLLLLFQEHAFVRSEYPVILSIEDHCSLVQQRKMAAIFQEQFGDALVTAPMDKNETELPSPERMKRRIILKHKKLPPEGVKDETTTRLVDVSTGIDNPHGMDIAHSLNSGILYLQDPDDLEWKPHFFVLTHNKIFYSEVRSQEDAENEDDDLGIGANSTSRASSVTSSGITGTGDQAELHFSESWFHGNLEKGREIKAK